MGKIYEYFKNISSDGKIGHAFLIGNTRYSDCKQDLENVLSDFLFCTKVSIDSNPDIYLIEPEGNSVTKSQVKSLLYNISTTSQINGKKVYIITACENLSDNVYNALLKTIEEPEENIYAFLITSNMESVGETIRSRCQTIFISSDSVEESDKKMYDIALEFVKKTEKNLINTIGKNNELYSIISSRDVFKQVLKEIFKIYMGALYYKVGCADECEDCIPSGDSVDEICRKILIVNGLIEKNNININKDMLIDKLIIDLWRCSNENSFN